MHYKIYRSVNQLKNDIILIGKYIHSKCLGVRGIYIILPEQITQYLFINITLSIFTKITCMDSQSYS